MKLLITAISLFTSSFFFSSYNGIPGYSCAKFCLWDIWGDFEISEIAYYFPFTCSNLMMILVPVLIIALKQKRVPIGLIVGQVILLGHVISWPIKHIIGGSIADIELGYYIWLLSMLLMLGCTLAKRKVELK